MSSLLSAKEPKELEALGVSPGEPAAGWAAQAGMGRQDKARERHPVRE
jgi:hypothetical protein